MPSSPLGKKHVQTTSSVACNHLPSTSYTVRRYSTWHVIITLEKHTRSNDFVRGMLSLPLESIHDQTMSEWHARMAFVKHTRLDDIGRGMPSSPFRSTKSQTKSSVICHPHPWAAHMVRRRPMSHAINAIARQK